MKRPVSVNLVMDSNDNLRYVIFVERNPVDVDYVRRIVRRIASHLHSHLCSCHLPTAGPLTSRLPTARFRDVAARSAHLQFMRTLRVRFIRPCTQPRRFYTVATSRRQKGEGENIRRLHSRLADFSSALLFLFFFFYFLLRFLHMARAMVWTNSNSSGADNSISGIFFRSLNLREASFICASNTEDTRWRIRNWTRLYIVFTFR